MTNETKWSIDQHQSEIAFMVGHSIITPMKGIFKTFEASIYTNQKDFTTIEIDLSIDPCSISTGDLIRDKHLQGLDFFDVKNHKQITFISNSIVRTETIGHMELWGELTIKGLTKKIKLDVKSEGISNDILGKEKARFSVEGKLNRSDWGLIWNTSVEKGVFLISNEIAIVCEIELVYVGDKVLTMELKN
jgi:polyisoprenoid-binding protein YceI